MRLMPHVFTERVDMISSTIYKAKPTCPGNVCIVARSRDPLSFVVENLAAKSVRKLHERNVERVLKML